MSDYPKILVRKAFPEITVQSAEEEAEKRAEGYYSPEGTHPDVGDGPPKEASGDVPPDPLVEEVVPATFGPADDGTGEGPTEGPADDDTHAKKGGKKK